MGGRCGSESDGKGFMTGPSDQGTVSWEASRTALTILS
jgi:hypothetical protein